MQLVFLPRTAELPEHLSFYFVNHNDYWNGFDAYWYSVNNYSILRYMAIMRWFSFGYYSVHVVFHCFIVLTGSIGLYRLLMAYAPNKNKLIFVVIFLLPSVLFWCSGMHKEGLIFANCGILLWNWHRLLIEGFSIKRISISIISFVFLYATRDFAALLLLPGLIGLLLSTKWPRYPLLIFVGLYGIGGYLLLSAHLVFPIQHILITICERQQEFDILRGNTYVGSPAFPPQIHYLIANIPHALFNSGLRPHLLEAHSPFQFMAALEVTVYLIIIVYSFRFKAVVPQHQRAILLLFLFFAISMFLLIGLVVPNLGAITRYRSFIWPFLLLPFVLRYDQKILNKLPL